MLKKTGLGLFVGLTVFATFGWFYFWRSPAFYTAYGDITLPTPILTAAQYDTVHETFERPYVVEVNTDSGGVLLYGASHTKDPADPQVADLRQRWTAFRPTVALVEGRLGFLAPGLMDPVEHYGESGLVYALARADGLPTYTWEPDREQEVALVLAEHPAERVALLYVLRPYLSNLRHGKPDDPDAYVEEFRRKRTRYPGLENTLPSIDAIDALWQRDFAGLPDWRDTSDEYGWPGYLAEVATTSNAVRDEHFARLIIDLVQQGERVFAVAGSSHAVKLDAALRAALATAP